MAQFGSGGIGGFFVGIFRCSLNGEVVQHDRTGDMVFTVPQLIASLSEIVPLLPGDVISCGTSLGAMPMRAGMVVEVAIEGVGVLRNRMTGG